MNQALHDPSHLRQTYESIAAQGEILLRQFQDELRTQVKELGVNGHVKARFKKFESFYEKLHRDHRDGEAKPLTDMLAFRVVCPFAEDVVKVERMLTGRYKVNETIHKGSQRVSEFGYESIHLVLAWPWQDQEQALPELPGASWVVEVQVRTILQDAWAEVEHELIYKGDWSLPNESAKRKLAAIAAALTLADTVFQELRVEVREIRQQQDKRRSMVQEKSHVMDSDHMARTLNRSALEHPEFIATAGNKEKIEKYLLHALKCHSHEEYDEAIDFYSRALALQPEPRICSIVHNHRGMAYFILSRTEEALADFSLAIANNNQNFRALSNRGMCYQLLHKMSDAVADFKSALEIKNNQEEVLVRLGQCYLEMGEVDEALLAVKDALSLNPKCEGAHKLQTRALSRMIH